MVENAGKGIQTEKRYATKKGLIVTKTRRLNPLFVDQA
jgi:hypothetical protein